jgi:hypothetical protein
MNLTSWQTFGILMKYVDILIAKGGEEMHVGVSGNS